MKKLIAIMVLSLCSFFGINAQAETSYQGQLTGTAADTIAGGSTGTYYLTVRGNKETVAFQYNIAKISGTVAGTIKVYGSIETTPANYVLLDTYNLTDASAIGGYSRLGNPYAKYKVVVAPTGTSSASYDVWAFHR